MNKSSNESTDFLEDEGFYQKKIKQYTFILKPYNAEKLIAVNYRSDIDKYTKPQQDSIIKEYNDYLCFVLEVKIDGFTGDISQYEEPGKNSDVEKKSNYYLFEMQNNLKLKDDAGNETPCNIYYYERLSELARSNRFIIGFKKPKTENIRLEYDNPYFGCGKINFSINKQHLALN